MSDPTRKPRGEAKLKLLPAPQQQEIIDWCGEKGATYAKVARRLGMDRNIDVSKTTVGDFYSWWHMRRRWDRATERTREAKELMAADPNLSLEQVEAHGQAVFLTEAVEIGGSAGLKGFVSISKLRLAQSVHDAEKSGFRLRYEQKEREIAQKDEALRLAREKFENARFKVAEQTKKLREKGATITDEERLEIVKAVDAAMGIS